MASSTTLSSVTLITKTLTTTTDFFNFSATRAVRPSQLGRRILNSKSNLRDHSLSTNSISFPCFRLRNFASTAAANSDPTAGGEDVIILDVKGMMCDGCAANVKRLLESRPQISRADVNLTTETAVVQPVSEAKVLSNWQKELGVELATHLTSCGFESNFRGHQTAYDLCEALGEWQVTDPPHETFHHINVKDFFEEQPYQQQAVRAFWKSAAGQFKLSRKKCICVGQMRTTNVTMCTDS